MMILSNSSSPPRTQNPSNHSATNQTNTKKLNTAVLSCSTIITIASRKKKAKGHRLLLLLKTLTAAATGNPAAYGHTDQPLNMQHNTDRNHPKPSKDTHLDVSFQQHKTPRSKTSKVTLNNIESAQNQAQTQPKKQTKTKTTSKTQTELSSYPPFLLLSLNLKTPLFS